MKKIILPFLATLLLGIGAKAQSFTNGTHYQIKLKGTNNLMDIADASNSPGKGIVIKTRSSSQHQLFTFIKVTDSVYNILTWDNLFVSLKYEPVAMSGGSQQSKGGGSEFKVIQDNAYNTPVKPVLEVTTPRPDLQRWKLIPVSGEENTYIIKSVAFPDKVLVPFNNAQGSALKLSTTTVSRYHKWVISEPQVD